MNVEDLREYCLSLSAEVEEKFPFTQFVAARDVLAFYISGHIFCYLDINDMAKINMKAEPSQIEELKEQYSFIGNPYNGSSKYWISVNALCCPDEKLRQFIRQSFELVKNRKRNKPKAG